MNPDGPPSTPDGPAAVCDRDAPPVAVAPPNNATAPETLCETLPPLASGTCEVTGTGTGKLLKGNVLTPTMMFRGGQVAVNAAGIITCVGCNCAAADQTVITCPSGAISPGLINTHDHITFTQNQPYTDGGVRYEHRHQWRRGQDGKPEIPAPGNANADQIRWGELRFLMGGATSIVGAGGQPGLLRNLDSVANQEGLNQRVVNFDTFPLDDIGGTRRTDDCNYGGSPTTRATIANDGAYEPHTSEGIDTTARNEFKCQSSTTYDTQSPGFSNNLLLDKTAMIHAIALTATDLDAMAKAGTGLIWSPRSNITLYGDTARVVTAARLGIEVALGTDWMPTGSMNLLRELRCAASLNSTYYGNYFSDVQLWQMVTQNAAAVTETDDVIGVIAPGLVADISIFAGAEKTYRAVIDAEPQDVALVMRGGKILYGDGAAVAGLATGCDVVDVCGTEKRVCLTSEVTKSFEQLKTAVGASMYPAFACGAPDNEPSCVPKRDESVASSSIYAGATNGCDGDGDGIDDAADRCPGVFDPIRPVDDGAQIDSDADGQGDACDPCPLLANSTACTPANPKDLDGDGVPKASDNCPETANTNQADGDGDGKGDACDACAADSNPGTAGCPTTIYKIKNGMSPVGLVARVTNVLVTGRGNNGFFVQVKEGDAGYEGADFSGLMVFTGSAPPVQVGQRVTIDGRITNFFGQLELDNIAGVTVTSPGPEAAPAPIAATYAEVKTGGPRAAKLEGVLISVGAATVTAVNTMFKEFTLTAGTDTLVVDDFLFVAPEPVVGTVMSGLRGILAFRNNESKLEPRSAADLPVPAPTIATLAPALSFARIGPAGPTFPTPLTITLTGPAQGNTTVAVTSGDLASLTVADVVVLDGQTTAVVPVTAIAQSPSVAVTATLGVAKTAAVRVLSGAEVPATVALTPPTANVTPGGTVTFTVALDVPAPTGGTAVALAVTPAAAGTVPPTVTVAENQVSATFTYTDTAATGPSTVTATLGPSTSSSTVTPAASCATGALATFTFTGAAGDEVTLPADGAAPPPGLASIPVMSRGSGVMPSAAGNTFSANNWTQNAALDADDYFSFSITPATNFTASLAALGFDERRSGTGIRQWTVRSSLDGFTANVETFSVPNDTLTRTHCISLGSAFSNLAAPVEFRIYGFVSGGTGGTWRLDNVKAIGSTLADP